MAEYPIVGAYRNILLVMELIIVFAFLEIATYFFYKLWKNRKESVPSVVELDWGLIFGSFGFAFIFFIASDFFNTDRQFFLVLAYLAISIAGIIFVFHQESMKKKKPKYILTPLLCAIPIILVILYWIAPSILQTVASMCTFVAFAILISYFLLIVKKIWAVYKLYSIGLFIGIMLWLVGYTGNSDIAISLFGGFQIRFLGDLFILFGLFLVAFFINSVPSLAEIGWRDKIKYVIITNYAGLELYSENFRERSQIDEILVAGAIYGINIFLKSVLEEQDNVKAISKGKDTILMEYGKNVIGILIVEQELEILKYLLKNLVNQFEEIFGETLANWNRDIRLFEPAKYIINEVFAHAKL